MVAAIAEHDQKRRLGHAASAYGAVVVRTMSRTVAFRSLQIARKAGDGADFPNRAIFALWAAKDQA